MDDSNRRAIQRIAEKLSQTSDLKSRLSLLEKMKQAADNNILKNSLSNWSIQQSERHGESLKNDSTLVPAAALLGELLPNLQRKINQNLNDNGSLHLPNTKSHILSGELDHLLRLPFILNQTRPKFNHLYTLSKKTRNDRENPFHYCLYWSIWKTKFWLVLINYCIFRWVYGIFRHRTQLMQPRNRS